MKFKEGDKVRVKRFKTRPSTWNDAGKMDHLMGKIVKIKSVGQFDNITIYDDVHKRDWSLSFSDIIPITCETIIIYRKDNEVIALDKSTGKKAFARCNPSDDFDFVTGAKLAFERLVDSGVREVKRFAEVGEYVKVLTEDGHNVPKGSIVKVIAVDSDGWADVKYDAPGCTLLRLSQYVVLEGYKPEPEPEKPKYYNGKVCCVHSGSNTTVGKIYEVIDGQFKDDAGDLRPSNGPKATLKAINREFSGTVLIEVIE